MRVVAAVDISGGISDAWSRVASFVPKLAGAIAILVIGYFVARIIARVVDRVLDRLGFDRVVERGGLRQFLGRSKYGPSEILSKIVFWAIFLFVLELTFNVFGPNPVSDVLQGLIGYLPNIIAAIIIVVIAAAIAKVVTDLLSSVLGRVQGGQTIARAAGIAILVFAGFAALDQLRIAPRIVTGLWYALLAAVVGSVIVAVGGGGIRTMQRYWERTAGRAEAGAAAARGPDGGAASGAVGAGGAPGAGQPQAEPVRPDGAQWNRG